jgi:hypothetical protein
MLDARETWAKTWPPLLAVGVVFAVGAPAAVASYRHARDVVTSTGDVVMAPWLPLSVDGLLVAALVVIWVRRRRGEAAGWGPWGAFLFGMVVTIAANLAAVDSPSPTAYAVALFPPLAFAITLELVALVAHHAPVRDAPGRQVVADLAASRDVPSSTVTTAKASPMGRAEDEQDDHRRDVPQDVPHPSGDARPGTSSDVPDDMSPTSCGSSSQASSEDVLARPVATSRDERKKVSELRKWIADQGGETPSPYAVKKRFGGSHDTAKRLLELAVEEPRMVAVN